MNEIEKAHHLAKFKKDVDWLRQNIGPDDIYEFAEQALMAADYFIYKWREWVDLEEETEKDKITGAWLKNVVGLRILRDMGHQGVIDTQLKDPEEL